MHLLPHDTPPREGPFCCVPAAELMLLVLLGTSLNPTLAAGLSGTNPVCESEATGLLLLPGSGDAIGWSLRVFTDTDAAALATSVLDWCCLLL